MGRKRSPELGLKFVSRKYSTKVDLRLVKIDQCIAEQRCIM
jgi:hypothetical protein